MLSAPPPTVISISPLSISMAAVTIACNPEAHRRFTVWAVLVSAQPDLSATSRARKALRLYWPTQPSTSSSICPADILARSIAPFTETTPRSTVVLLFREPPKLPTAVRTAERITGFENIYFPLEVFP